MSERENYDKNYREDQGNGLRNVGICEAHLNDAVQQAFSVKKVTSSHTKKQTVIISENEISEQELRDVIAKTGYELVSASSEPYEKKPLFGFGKTG